MSGPSCLPLTKFSYATVSNEHIVPIPWIHLSSKTGLFAIFEMSPTHLEHGQIEDRPKLKVLRDPEVMEDIDLYLLAKEAHRSMNTAPTSLLDAQVPQFAIIVKIPNIAIKYPLTSGQIRRFQMRFASHEIYYDAMKLLARANVPIVEAGSFPTKTPQTAQLTPPSNILPSDSASQIGEPNNHLQAFPSMDQPAAPSLLGSGQMAASPSHAMPPPAFRALGQAVTQTSMMQPSVTGSSHHIRGDHSTISLSTGTTLVPTSHPRHGLGSITASRDTRITLPVDQGHNSNPPVTSEPIGLSLPPIRQLPFSKPMEALQTSTDINTTNNSVISTDAATAMVDQPTTSTADTTLTTIPPSGKRKRAASKATPKSTAAKKPRAISPRKRCAPKRAPKPQTPNPLTEELLKEPELGRMTRSRSTLSSRFRTHDEFGTLGAVVPDILVSNPKATVQKPFATEVPSPTAETTIEEVPEMCREPEISFPCTPADQIIQAQTPGSPHALVDSASHSWQVDSQEYGFEQELNGASAMSKNPALSPMPGNTIRVPLDKEATVSSTDDPLDAWASLPVEKRDPKLRDLLCRVILQPRFIDLCKSLEGMWETMLLEPRLGGRR